jgi:F-type H+-transporting ATPase subunit b
MLNPANAEFWVLVGFLAFMAILLYVKVPGVIGKSLDDRADAIRKELDEARRLREEAQELLADYQRKSREAEEEAKSIVAQAKREAETLAAETRRSLAEQVERRAKLAEDKIKRAEAQALTEVRATAVDVALAAAEKLVRGEVAGDSGKSLIEQSIRELKSKLN